MISPFIAAANELLARHHPCVGCTFDPNRPFGPVTGDLAEPLLNLGAAGAMFIMAKAESFTGADIDAVFHFGPDRDEFERWFAGLDHTFHGTVPETAEMRALKGLDERANAGLYAMMGLPVASQ